MSTHLYLAPAAASKTATILARAREASRGLAAIPRVVPTHLQVRARRGASDRRRRNNRRASARGRSEVSHEQ